MNTEWQRFEGTVPRALSGLGETPLHHNGHWWVKQRDAAILRYATPGFGDAAAFDAAAAALANQVAAPIQTADSYLSAGETANALQAYQAAGQTAVSTNGPQIDAAGAPNVTQPYTQFAWGLNGQLAAATDATAAQGLAHNILTTLQDAIRDGQASLSAPAPAQSSDLTAAAQALKAYLDQNGVPPESQVVAEVRTFQQAYIAAGNTLAYGADGKYGPATTAALAAVLGSAPNPKPGPEPQPAAPDGDHERGLHGADPGRRRRRRGRHRGGGGLHAPEKAPRGRRGPRARLRRGKSEAPARARCSSARCPR
jgi:hypothetical protein